MMAEIRVHASFPHVDADLNVDPSNWHWVHCLTFPLKTLHALQFSHNPYKWIRYAIGVIVGTEGDLSFSPDSPSAAVDYNAVLPAESLALYYHTSDEESVTTTRRAQFREDVAERNGRTYVLMSMNEVHCDAVHLLPHSKGDTYIATYTRHRSRDPTGGDVIKDIDSIRNGLLLNPITHKALGANVAFLMTPNFAMTTADVDPTMPPTERRCTAHSFKPNDPFFLGSIDVPSGSTLRISESPTWPPAILFDFVYAGAVLHHFGTRTLKDEVTSAWKDVFDPGAIVTAADADYKTVMDERAAAAKRERKQAQYEGPDTLDMLMTLPYIMVPPDKRKVLLREAQARAEVTEQGLVQEKVDTWMKQIADA